MEPLSEYSKEMAKGSIWSIIGGVFYKLIAFLYLVLIAQTVPQDSLGLFYLALNVISIFSITDDLGLTTALVRYVPYFEGKGEGTKVRALLKTTFILVTASALLLMGLVWLLANPIGAAYHNPQLPLALKVLSFFLILSNIFRAGNSFVQGKANILSMQIEQNLQNVLKFVITIFLIYFYGASFWALAGGLLLSYLLTLPLSFIDLRRLLVPIQNEKEQSVSLKQIFTEVMPFGLLLSVIQSLGAIVAATNSVILGYMTNPAMATTTVAIFSIATTIPYGLLSFSSAVGSIFLPVISRLHGKNEKQHMAKVAETAQRWTILTTLPPAIAMILFAPELISLVSGPSYVSGSLAMSIFAFALMVSALSMIFSLSFSAIGILGIQLRILVVAGVMNIFFNILLIPQFGMTGSAIASLISYISSTFLYRYYAGKMLGFSFPKDLLRMFAAFILSFLLIFFLKPFLPDMNPIQTLGSVAYYIGKLFFAVYLAAILVLTFVIFLIFSIVLRCYKEEDVGILERALKKVMVPELLIRIAVKIVSYGVLA